MALDINAIARARQEMKRRAMEQAASQGQSPVARTLVAPQQEPAQAGVRGAVSQVDDPRRRPDFQRPRTDAQSRPARRLSPPTILGSDGRPATQPEPAANREPRTPIPGSRVERRVVLDESEESDVVVIKDATGVEHKIAKSLIATISVAVKEAIGSSVQQPTHGAHQRGFLTVQSQPVQQVAVGAPAPGAALVVPGQVQPGGFNQMPHSAFMVPASHILVKNTRGHLVNVPCSFGNLKWVKDEIKNLTVMKIDLREHPGIAQAIANHELGFATPEEYAAYQARKDEMMKQPLGTRHHRSASDVGGGNLLINTPDDGTKVADLLGGMVGTKEWVIDWNRIPDDLGGSAGGPRRLSEVAARDHRGGGGGDRGGRQGAGNYGLFEWNAIADQVESEFGGQYVEAEPTNAWYQRGNRRGPVENNSSFLVRTFGERY